MNVLIVGCGRVGAQLARRMSQNGHDVSIIDADERNFALLGNYFQGITVRGVAMDMDVLRDAGIEGCDALAVVSQDDNLNITVSQMAREFFGVKNIITRVSDPQRERVFEHFGLSTVCPTKIAAETVFSSLIDDKHKEKLTTFGTCTMASARRPVDDHEIGRDVREIPLPESEALFGVQHANSRISLYDGRQKIILQKGDQLLMNRIVD